MIWRYPRFRKPPFLFFCRLFVLRPTPGVHYTAWSTHRELRTAGGLRERQGGGILVDRGRTLCSNFERKLWGFHVFHVFHERFAGWESIFPFQSDDQMNQMSMISISGYMLWGRGRHLPLLTKLLLEGTEAVVSLHPDLSDVAIFLHFPPNIFRFLASKRYVMRCWENLCWVYLEWEIGK